MAETQTQMKPGQIPAKRDPQQEKLSTLRQLLEKQKLQIKMALPKHMTPDRMIRIAITTIQKNPKLIECTPISVLAVVIQAAQLGLELDGATNMAHMVPFNNTRKNVVEAQFIAGYRGLIALARRSKEVSVFDAHPVYEKDRFEFEFGTNQRLVHVPSREKDRGAVTHFYAIAKLVRDGSFQFDVMTAAEVNEIRDGSHGYLSAKKYAKEGQEPDTPWASDYAEMGKKTVSRRICKYLPISTELAVAVALDEKADAGIPQDLGTIIDVDAVGTETAPAEAGKGLVVQPQAKKITDQQAAEFGAACDKAGITDEMLADYLADKIGSAKINDIPVDFYAEALTWAQSSKQK